MNNIILVQIPFVITDGKFPYGNSKIHYTDDIASLYKDNGANNDTVNFIRYDLLYDKSGVNPIYTTVIDLDFKNVEKYFDDKTKPNIKYLTPLCIEYLRIAIERDKKVHFAVISKSGLGVHIWYNIDLRGYIKANGYPSYEVLNQYKRYLFNQLINDFVEIASEKEDGENINRLLSLITYAVDSIFFKDELSYRLVTCLYSKVIKQSNELNLNILYDTISKEYSSSIQLKDIVVKDVELKEYEYNTNVNFDLITTNEGRLHLARQLVYKYGKEAVNIVKEMDLGHTRKETERKRELIAAIKNFLPKYKATENKYTIEKLVGLKYLEVAEDKYLLDGYFKEEHIEQILKKYDGNFVLKGQMGLGKTTALIKYFAKQDNKRTIFVVPTVSIAMDIKKNHSDICVVYWNNEGLEDAYFQPNKMYEVFYKNVFVCTASKFIHSSMDGIRNAFDTVIVDEFDSDYYTERFWAEIDKYINTKSKRVILSSATINRKMASILAYKLPIVSFKKVGGEVETHYYYIDEKRTVENLIKTLNKVSEMNRDGITFLFMNNKTLLERIHKTYTDKFRFRLYTSDERIYFKDLDNGVVILCTSALISGVSFYAQKPCNVSVIIADNTINETLLEQLVGRVRNAVRRNIFVLGTVSEDDLKEYNLPKGIADYNELKKVANISQMYSLFGCDKVYNIFTKVGTEILPNVFSINSTLTENSFNLSLKNYRLLYNAKRVRIEDIDVEKRKLLNVIDDLDDLKDLETAINDYSLLTGDKSDKVTVKDLFELIESTKKIEIDEETKKKIINFFRKKRVSLNNFIPIKDFKNLIKASYGDRDAIDEISSVIDNIFRDLIWVNTNICTKNNTKLVLKLYKKKDRILEREDIILNVSNSLNKCKNYQFFKYLFFEQKVIKVKTDNGYKSVKQYQFNTKLAADVLKKENFAEIFVDFILDKIKIKI
jgi:hypothetical protein